MVWGNHGYGAILDRRAVWTPRGDQGLQDDSQKNITCPKKLNGGRSGGGPVDRENGGAVARGHLRASVER